MSSEWKPWFGGVMPVAADSEVYYMMGNEQPGEEEPSRDKAGVLRWAWHHGGGGGDITMYRLVSSDSAAVAKDPNPKDALGAARIDMTLISSVAMMEEALAMAEGAIKYGAYNYTASPVKARVYIGAMLRHLWKYIMGETRDAKTGVHHLGSVRASAGIVLTAEAYGTLIDDRPHPLEGASEQLDAMEARVKALRELFKSFKPKHFTREARNGQGAGGDVHREGAPKP